MGGRALKCAHELFGIGPWDSKKGTHNKENKENTEKLENAICKSSYKVTNAVCRKINRIYEKSINACGKNVNVFSVNGVDRVPVSEAIRYWDNKNLLFSKRSSDKKQFEKKWGKTEAWPMLNLMESILAENFEKTENDERKVGIYKIYKHFLCEGLYAVLQANGGNIEYWRKK